MHSNTASKVEYHIAQPFVDLELNWLQDCVRFRLSPTDRQFPMPLPLTGISDGYANYLQRRDFGWIERLIVAVALACELRPSILMSMLEAKGQNSHHGIQYNESTKEFIPTLHTVRFLLGGLPAPVLGLFLDEDSPLVGTVLDLRREGEQFTALATKFSLMPEFLHTVIWNRPYIPGNFFSFPAHPIQTNMRWEDLVIPQEIEEEIGNIDLWLKHGRTMGRFWNKGHQFKPGYRVLFYGPPGTGKTLTASLLGKENGRPVYRVDLSQVVSKYIGETEKQLKKVFDKAANRDWILFFDEADSLFGKRGKVSDARDRYANQEISYLLQRIEGFDGLVILATNLKENMDEAFIRRFQCVIRFVKPAPKERLRLWQNALPDHIPLASDVDLNEISQKYELTGAGIVNVVQYICLKALAHPEPQIRMEDVVQGVRTEYGKDNRLL